MGMGPESSAALKPILPRKERDWRSSLDHVPSRSLLPASESHVGGENGE